MRPSAILPFAPDEAAVQEILHRGTKRSVGYPAPERGHLGRSVLVQVVEDGLTVLSACRRGTISRANLYTHPGKDLADAALLPSRAFRWVDSLFCQLFSDLAHAQALPVQFCHPHLCLDRQARVPTSRFASIKSVRLQMAVSAKGDRLCTTPRTGHDMMVFGCGIAALEARGVSSHTLYSRELSLTKLSFAETGHGNAYA